MPRHGKHLMSPSVDSVKALKYQFIMFQYLGIWPPNPPTWSSHLYTFVAFYMLSAGFIGSLAASIIFVKSMKQVIDNLIVSSSVLLVVIKGIIIYFTKPKALNVLKLMRELDARVDGDDEESVLAVIYDQSGKLLKLFLGAYMTAWVALAFQSLWADKEESFWSSTALYPYEISQNKIVYWLVLMFQGFANFVECILVAAADTYGVILYHILGGHVEVLALRLKKLGFKRIVGKVEPDVITSDAINDGRQYNAGLKECVQTYIVCIR